MEPKQKKRNREHQAAHRARMTDSERKAFDKARYLKYKEKYNEQSAAWGKANRHKGHAAAHQNQVRNKYPETYKNTDITTKDLAGWLKDTRGNPCPYCGAEAFHIDHMTPLACGGEHQWSNIELICKTCNFAKNDLTKEQYTHWIKNVLRVHCLYI